MIIIEKETGKCEVLLFKRVLSGVEQKQRILHLVCIKLNQIPVEPNRVAVFLRELAKTLMLTLQMWIKWKLI